MPHDVILKGPKYAFSCYFIQEAKDLGIIDSAKKHGSHIPISKEFEQGEGRLLCDWLKDKPSSILVETKRHQIIVYKPRVK